MKATFEGKPHLPDLFATSHVDDAIEEHEQVRGDQNKTLYNVENTADHREHTIKMVKYHRGSIIHHEEKEAIELFKSVCRGLSSRSYHVARATVQRFRFKQKSMLEQLSQHPDQNSTENISEARKCMFKDALCLISLSYFAENP